MPKTVVLPPGTSPPIAPFSPGTMADGIVYVSGTLAFDKDNNIVHAGDAAAQTRHVLETIKSVVETAGGTMDDVTFNSIFIRDWADYAALNKVYAEYFPGDKPARFCIQCGLVKPDALVEIAIDRARGEEVAGFGPRNDERFLSSGLARRYRPKRRLASTFNRTMACFQSKTLVLADELLSSSPHLYRDQDASQVANIAGAYRARPARRRRRDCRSRSEGL